MLFEVNKYKIPEQLPAGPSGSIDQGDIIAPSGEKLSELINLVDHGRTLTWMSAGDWSMHHMLEALLNKTGPADVWISTYAFSERPARLVSVLKNAGTIKNLFCLIDSRVDVRAPSALAMMRNNCDRLKLCATHAKVTVIKNDHWFLVVVGSANYTTNKRIEAGFISTDSAIVSFHQKWIINELIQ